MRARYLVRPKANHDLDEQAYYLATRSGDPVLGHEFLSAAHETFALLATQPEMGWPCRFRPGGVRQLRLFRIAGFESMLVLYRPRRDGVEVLRVVHGSRDVRLLLRREGIE